jgi:hypothetical protein
VKPLNTEMAARLMEKLKADSEAPDIGAANDGPAPAEPPRGHARMATPDAPAGIELDEHGNPIPLAERTAHHREEAAGSTLARKIGEAD